MLSGFAEIAYDTSNRQSVQLSLETGIERPFILSTPRLSSPEVLDLRIPFRHPGLVELFRSRVHGTTLSRLRELLELDGDEADALGQLPIVTCRITSTWR